MHNSRIFTVLFSNEVHMSELNTVDSRYYDICYNEVLLITIPNLYPNHSQTIEIQTGYIDSLVILIHLPYPSSIVITRVYCTLIFEFWGRGEVLVKCSRICAVCCMFNWTAELV